jgi:hypothetical protein
MACTSGTSPVCLVHLVSLVHLVDLVQPNNRDRPDRPNRPDEQDRLADCFSILLTTLLLRLLMCPGERSGRVGKVGLPESKNQMRIL